MPRCGQAVFFGLPGGLPAPLRLDWFDTGRQFAAVTIGTPFRPALRKIAKVCPFQDDDSFNDYAVLQLEKGEMVCGDRVRCDGESA